MRVESDWIDLPDKKKMVVKKPKKSVAEIHIFFWKKMVVTTLRR